jgi:hypothetical protein
VEPSNLIQLLGAIQFVGGDDFLLREIGVYRGQIDGLSGLLHDESAHPFALYGIGCAHDGGIRNTLTNQQQGFDLFGRDTRAAPDDHILEPPAKLVIFLPWARKLAFKASNKICHWS